MYKEFKGKYFGPFQVKDTELTKEKTYLGNNRIVLILDNDIRKDLPLEVAKNVITDKKSDLTELRERWTVPVVKKLLVILTESELGNNDLHYALDIKLGESIKMAADRVQSILFGKPKEEVSLMDLERKLREYVEKDVDNKHRTNKK